jgi:hypothetical protein
MDDALNLPRLPSVVQVSTGPAQPEIKVTPTASGLAYCGFNRRHASYNAAYWERIRALYKGGAALLQNPAILQGLFIRNGNEPEGMYAWRCAIAMYLNYCSEIVDFIVAGLGTDPIRVEQDGKPSTDEWVADFVKDSTPPGGDVQDLQTLVTDVVLEALLTQTCWVELCKPELPALEEGEFISELERKALGKDRVWAYVLKAEQVVNWQETIDGDLEWALIHRVKEVQENFWEAPMIRETWTRWTREDRSEWEITYPKDKPPQPTTIVPLVVEDEPHTCGRVPLIRFKVKAGLWVMDKLESIARAHFNKLNTLDVSERRALMPQLYEFLGNEVANARAPMMSGLAGRDPDRATSTPRGPNWVQQRGANDSAAFVGPDVAPFQAAWNSLDRLRDEMHRIVYQMSLAAQLDSGAALSRSGESRRLDRASVMTILMSLGKGLRDFTLNLVTTARAMAAVDTDDLDLSVVGAQKFDAEEIDQLVSQTEILAGLQPPSPTAMVEIMMRALRRVLDHLDEDAFGTIREELENAYTPENLALMAPVDPLELEKVKAEAAAANAPPPGEEPAPGAPPAKPGAAKAGKAPAKGAKPAAKPAPKE